MKLSEATLSQQNVKLYWSRERQDRRPAANKVTFSAPSHHIPEACRIAPRNHAFHESNNLMVP